MIFGFNTDVRFADTVYHVQSEAREHEHLLQTQVFLKGRCIGKHATSYSERTQQPGFREEDMHEMLKQQHRRFIEAVRAGSVESLLDAPEQTSTGMAAAAGTDTGTRPAVAEVSPAAITRQPPAVEEDLTAELAIAQPQPVAQAVVAPPPEPTPVSAAAAAPKPATPELILKPAGVLIGKGLSVDCLPPSPTDEGSAVIIAVQIADENGPAAGAQVSCRVTSGQAAATYVYATSGPAGVADVHLALKDLDLATTGVLIQASHRGKSASRKYKLHPAS